MESILVTLRHNNFGNETFICSYFDEIIENTAVVQYIEKWIDEYKDFDPSISYQPLENIPTMSEFILGKGL